MWFDETAPKQFGSYKLPIVDIVGGDPSYVLAGVSSAAGAVQGARGGVEVPEDEIDDIKAHLSKVYKKARQSFDDESIVAPWEDQKDTSDKSRQGGSPQVVYELTVDDQPKDYSPSGDVVYEIVAFDS